MRWWWYQFNLESNSTTWLYWSCWHTRCQTHRQHWSILQSLVFTEHHCTKRFCRCSYSRLFSSINRSTISLVRRPMRSIFYGLVSSSRKRFDQAAHCGNRLGSQPVLSTTLSCSSSRDYNYTQEKSLVVEWIAIMGQQNVVAEWFSQAPRISYIQRFRRIVSDCFVVFCFFLYYFLSPVWSGALWTGFAFSWRESKW